MGNQFNLKSLELQTNDCSFFNSDQLIKFANSVETTSSEPEPLKKLEVLGETQEVVSIDKVDSLNFNFSFNEKVLGKDLAESGQEDKKRVSPSESPHHEFSCSLSSSDSGCRSTASFLAEEDSGNFLELLKCHYKKSSTRVLSGIFAIQGIASLQTTKSSFTASYLTISKGVKHNSCLTEENLSSFNEELSKKASKSAANEDANTEVLSDTDSDTSDDASDIPDSECLDDLASLEDLEEPAMYPHAVEKDLQTAQVFNQVMDKCGVVLRKKLDYGIYRSVNNTMSLFIEPQDVLKKVDDDEYVEYSLFPNGMESVDHYLSQLVQ